MSPTTSPSWSEITPPQTSVWTEISA
jgi:hypothetical protein